MSILPEASKQDYNRNPGTGQGTPLSHGGREPIDLAAYGVTVNLNPHIGGAVYSNKITAHELLGKAQNSLEEARRDNVNPIYAWEMKSPFWVQTECKRIRLHDMKLGRPSFSWHFSLSAPGEDWLLILFLVLAILSGGVIALIGRQLGWIGLLAVPVLFFVVAVLIWPELGLVAFVLHYLYSIDSGN